MPSGLQLGNAIQGVEKGFGRIDQRKDQEQQRELRGLQVEGAKLGMEETKTRMDEKARMREGMEAVRSFMTGGDTRSPVEFMNKYSPEGVRYHNLEPLEDGKYEVVVERDGELKKDVISQDDVGQSLMLVAHTDPSVIFQQQRQEKQAAQAKQEERQYESQVREEEQQFDMNKMREEYRLKGAIEKIKLGGEGGKMDRKISNDLWSRAAKGRGLDMDTLDFDSKTGMMAAYDAQLSSVVYEYVDNTNDAHLRAKSIVNKLSQQIDERLDQQEITGPQRDQVYQMYMDRAINAASEKFRAQQGGKGLKQDGGDKTQKGGEQTGKAGPAAKAAKTEKGQQKTKEKQQVTSDRGAEPQKSSKGLRQTKEPETVQEIRDWFDKNEYTISGKGKATEKRARDLVPKLERRLQSLTPKQRKLAEAFIEKHKKKGSPSKDKGLRIAQNAQE